MKSFKVIGAKAITQWLNNHGEKLLDSVADCYCQFASGKTICPDSYFLRYPEQPQNRIIALPASIESAQAPVSGIKWIASFPGNLTEGLDRASAVVILNDRQTGYPIACLEGAQISSFRTAASAVLGAKYLHTTPGKIEHLAIVGSGLISHTIVSLLEQTGWQIDKMTVIDLDLKRANQFCEKFPHINGIGSDDVSVIARTDMVIFATSAISPYVSDQALFAHNPTVIHMSLRDIAPELIILGQNFADDVEHAIKANTSLQLAEQLSGNRAFMAGNIVNLIKQEVKPDFSKPRIYSPFGMGILDVMLGYQIYNDTSAEDLLEVDDFFPQPYS
ncbi:N-((2S)-2-amino-2-carboxyethyl)-L-glutamate dehydrogenase [Pseudoalteromonas holothuriae]|uniref:N-((2S)-2-amino-2-carboxyethyl)-L-glutamate dehydrogenase n=1 Tax=Pseudoalteromonas holothuriae TaxID=2963714 RepID=A0A9W4W248_9GAMM|nr:MULTISPECIES: 2,3-diaminopropionate biosynthesis protein SbnB [unclassified Pseudoalteromonas]CAH9063874.1 N-((2S)-2-amino-2-carboxyethyl)-L-glutamate dehydrogenase [Pseudoalteromonas sp. CIP111854]CAH9064565.1 N-((2S)-2-amino-2-carboxyethyl)-L-glutamate dehydrogenase [Pseudoalteromonas sp. CIP111951]